MGTWRIIAYGLVLQGVLWGLGMELFDAGPFTLTGAAIKAALFTAAMSIVTVVLAVRRRHT